MNFFHLKNFFNDWFLNYSFNFNYSFLNISFDKDCLCLFVWSGNLLDYRNSLLNIDFNQSLFSNHNLNYFLDCVENVDRFLNCVGDWNRLLFCHLNDLRNIDEIIDNSLNLNVFNLFNCYLFSHFNLFDMLIVSYNFNQPLL